jgi:antirestriction protein ArdC
VQRTKSGLPVAFAAHPTHRGTDAKEEGPMAREDIHNSNPNTLYQEVTDRIIAELEAGIVPWVQPWGSSEGGAGLGLPRNARTLRTYSGINILLLWNAVIKGGYGAQSWLTFKQALELGGCVRKGERGWTVCFADSFVPKSEKDRAMQDGGDPQSIPFLKRYTVFNVAQCDGLQESPTQSNSPTSERAIVPRAEALIAATGASFQIGGEIACYVPKLDAIRVPPQTAFGDQINYYRTAFHELGHWTGHASRLARDLSAKFASNGYAREELFAELATAFVCATLGIVPTVRHADYVGDWLDVLKEDARAIFKAASMASKAADYILAFEAKTIEAEAAA